jgi:uncharacterized membrane protein
VTPQFFDSSIFGSQNITYPEIDFASAHPILCYNRTSPRDDAAIHIEVATTGDPVAASRTHGAGTTFAYMSDPAPHWGVNFVQWDQYQKFWVGALENLLALP